MASLRRPGGQTTGFTFLAPESAGKRLQLLKELKPRLSRVAVLYARDEYWDNYWGEMRRVAQQLGLTLVQASVERIDDVESTIATAVRQHAEALIAFPDGITLNARERIAATAITYRLPTVFEVRGFVAAGGLLSYGPDWRHLGRRGVAGYVDRIVKGAAAGDLPIQQPTQFELIVNLKTARMLKLSVPKSLLAQATEVLE